MTSQQNLYYAFGQLAYAIAIADGRLQKEEEEKFMHILTALHSETDGPDISEIIFKILSGERMDAATAYDWAMKEIRVNSNYLSPALKGQFIKTLKDIAAVFPPVTGNESALIERFKKDISPLQGDPVYYEQEQKNDIYKEFYDTMKSVSRKKINNH